ncbi:MAG TPA: 4-hydroxy-3-methylbut-2-enyl diphosphate reductase [Spirochaetales bacterium]|nr:4-hydroxy-3-methylbut-2-enyl diphosphate reductase [Spirochaetales bacterium]HRY55740.1 4-hydroxy-3-methylbut-2-enyl diphosphate reductase [Spirochaetia bacterium]HRZ65144.1 4-hydroxy-3-methylbut-2-enyl diphosphate reductase [Spirochaetia bacterium]
MEVIRASVLGCCMGVQRALDLALETAAAESAAGRPAGAPAVYSLGPLIHNPQAVAELAARGILPLGPEEIDERVRGAAVVIRAHGVPPALRRRLEAAGARVVDATCPRVIASQRRAAAFAREGRTVLLAGDRDHAEIAGIAGCAAEAGGGRGACLVLGSAEEAAAMPIPAGPAAVIAQTTIKAEEYRAICDALAARLPELEVVDSICPATEERRLALAELAAGCEALVIVGGRNSANTTRLLHSARALGKPAWQVERAAELPAAAFGYSRVGLAAGASTPESIVAAVEAALREGPAQAAGAAG